MYEVDQANTLVHRHVLLIEDDADLRDALRDVLVKAGHDVATANDGADGLRQLRIARPDVVVLDLMMPEVDGWQFRIAQRSDPAIAGTPVVVISASNSATAAAIDADLFIQKPLDGKTLLHAIDQVIAAAARRGEPTKVAQADRLAALGTLAAGLAHEINNPLTYMLLHVAQAQRLAASLANDQNRAEVAQLETLLRGASEGADRIRNIMTGIRTFARPEDDALKVIDVRVPLESALKLAMNEIRHRARLTKHYADPPEVFANEGRLGQVFLNLITNAVQAIAEGDARGNELRVSAEADAGGDLVVEIADTGHGIPAHLLSRVFEPFFSTKPSGHGTGLGLSISQDIIRPLGGRITVDSEVGRGTTFRVVLPAARRESAC